MARYEQSYEGERRTAYLGVQLTPSEREAIQTAAEAAGASLSQYVRELCLRRSDAGVVAGTRRNPEALLLMRQLSAIGNNLNQLARHANLNGAVPEETELRAAIDELKAAIARVIAL